MRRALEKGMPAEKVLETMKREGKFRNRFYKKFVKKYEVLIGMGLLMGCVQFSWNMMQHQMETGEQNKESPWLRVSFT